MGKPKGKSVSLPGAKLGYPMFHAVTGNLPVLTSKFHHPPGLSEGATLAPSDYEYITGNLAVLSRELARTTEDDLMPGWVQLVDPVTKRSFWWNVYYRSRRDMKPAANDDGRKGRAAGETEMYRIHAQYRALRDAHLPPPPSDVPGAEESSRAGGAAAVPAVPPAPPVIAIVETTAAPLPAPPLAPPAKRYAEFMSLPHLWKYYVDRSNQSTSWTKPADFDGNGEPYAPKWEEKWDAEAKTRYWVLLADGSRVSERPVDFDNVPLSDATQAHVDPGSGHTYYWNPLTSEHTWVAPTGWPRKEPTEPPPAAPPLPPAPAPPPAPAALPPPPAALQPPPAGEPAQAPAKPLAAAAADLKRSRSQETDEDEEEDDTLIFPDHKGYLKKKGGGTSLFGSTGWKERFVVARRGILTYYDNQDDWEKQKEPLKGVTVTLRYYRVDMMPETPLGFALTPLPPEVIAGIDTTDDGDSEGASPRKKAPRAKRVYEFEAASKEAKVKWLRVLRGRRADGRHRADSAEFTELVAKLSASSRSLSITGGSAAAAAAK